MLECGGVLRTWALQQPPNDSKPQVVEALPDHRLAYLEYEGEVSGGRGSVSRWDAGTYEPANADVRSDGSLWIRVASSRLCGEIKLARVNDAWVFQYFAS